MVSARGCRVRSDPPYPMGPNGENRVPVVLCSTLFHRLCPNGALNLGPTCVLMVSESHVPVWVTDHYEEREFQVDYPDTEGRIEELNALIQSGKATQVPGKYIHAPSASLAHLRGMEGEEEEEEA